jgi:two-component system response regulator YesN
LVRLGLQEKIDWQSIGVELCLAASNGADAAEFMEFNAVDIVLTDIRMPEMDGIVLAAWIRENRPDTRIVFLTGYNDFDYAKSALKSGVEDYLLKPVDKQEITRVVGAIADDVVRRKRQREDQAKIEQLLSDNMGVIRSRFLISLLQPTINQDMAYDYLRYFKMEHLMEGANAALLMDVGQQGNALPREENKALLELILKDAIPVHLRFALFGDDRNRMVLLITGEAGFAPGEVTAVAEGILEAAYGKGVPLTIGMGGAYTGAENICRSYDEADQALTHGYFYSRGTVIPYQGLNSGGIRKNQSRADNSRSTQELKAAIARRDWPAASDLLDARYRNMQSTPGDDDEANMQILDLFTNLFGLISEWGMDISAVFDRQDMVHILQQRSALEDVYLFLKDKYKKMFNLLHDADKEHRSSVTNAIKKYVEENYACNLTLDDISGRVFLNRSYISTLFSKENGVTLSNYIMMVRVQHAMKIMLDEPNEKLFSISARVGYPDEKYFSKIFKRVTGETPQQFRANLRHNK